ncbi:XRE family transcriptional regulator [Dethiosulfovibrio sp. F2B]|uniref:LexA family protein n=1 Tax=Dethiosulfovibrio faecalis TaxID=2720018 RepID=UPI001F2861D3|nr:XRE family transcriptional regulator [Dethiosulfovibrio faecalis]MCF4150582.1 XRE family transcriptional regulator [Dethiosulfovibrio faecalis]
MTRGERLRRTRKDQGLTQTELARLSGVKQNTVSQVENDRIGLSIETWESLASVLGCSVGYLVSGEGDQKSFGHRGSAGKLSFSQWIDVPILDDSAVACAGNGIGGMAEVYAGAEDSIMLPGELLGTVSVNADRRPFIITVEGDSMEEAGILDGSQVVVNPEEEVYDGDPALVSFGRNGDWAVKWVYWQRNGAAEIRSSSLRYPPRSFSVEDIDEGLFQIIGKVVRTLGKPKRGA